MDTGRPPRVLVITLDSYQTTVRRFPDHTKAEAYLRKQWGRGRTTIVAEQLRQTGDFAEMDRVDIFLDQDSED